MTHRTLLLGVLIALLLAVLPAAAQEATPESSAMERSTLGPYSVEHNDNWLLVEGPRGVILLAETQADAQGSASVGDSSIVVQVNLFGLNRVARLGDDPDALTILGGLLTTIAQDEDELPEIVEFPQENYTFARADLSNDDVGSYIYTAIFSETTFAVMTISVNAQERLAEMEEDILAMLDTSQVQFDAPFPDDSFTKYADLPQSVTEDGLPVLGDPEAPVEVWLVTSFDCPTCRFFHDEFFPQLVERAQDGEIYIVFVPVYGSGELPNGDSAARAAICVGMDNFWGFQDVLFSWQDFGAFAFSYERLQNAAVALDVSADSFDDCYIADETSQRLRVGLDIAEEYLGGLSTPTILVEEQVMPSDINSVLAGIDAALEAAQDSE